MARKLTTEEVIERFREIHGDKYDYSEFEYINATTKGKIICPIHGEFWQSSNVHLRGVKCPKCAFINKDRDYFRLTKEIFLERANKRHSDKYEYDLSNFENSNSNIMIKCPKHGWFEQNVRRHLNGQGCPKCGADSKREKMAISLEEILNRFREIHGDKYDYSKFEYENCHAKGIIICPIHGEFLQTSNSHLLGNGCPKCVGRDKTTEEFIIEAKQIHGDRYDYSLTNYVNASTKVEIKCNQCGKTFYQVPWSHLQNHGCPYCKMSKLEIEIEDFLKENEIEYESQKRFEWLGKQSLDFYLPKYNIGIECQGEQHFYGSRCFGKKEMQDVIIERDVKKYNLCNANGVKLLYYSNVEVDGYFEEIITDNKRILEIIEKEMGK